MWELSALVGEYFGQAVYVHDTVGARVIRGRYVAESVDSLYRPLCWQLGIPFQFRDGAYYIGGQADVLSVLSHPGIDGAIKGSLKGVTVYNDKLLIQGDESSVAKISATLGDLLRVSEADFFLSIEYATISEGDTYGIELSRAVEYYFTWENILQSGGNPLQMAAMSLVASAKFSADVMTVESEFSGRVLLRSGRPFRYQVGAESLLETYSQGDFGSVVSGYQRRETGLIIQLLPYWHNDRWYCDAQLERSVPSGATGKELSLVSQSVSLSDGDFRVLLVFDLGDVNYTLAGGLPVIRHIPWLGRVVGVNRSVSARRRMVVSLGLPPNPSP